MPKISMGGCAPRPVTVIAVWLIVVLLSFFSSNHTVAQSQVDSQQAPQSTITEPEGTAQSPFFVEVTPNPKSAQQIAQEAQDRLENHSLERRLANWTVVLAIATIGLILATAVLGVLGHLELRETRRFLKAATDSAQAAITANQIAVTNSERQLRAYVTVQEINVHIHRHPERVSPIANIVVPGNPHTYRFSVILKNGGMTPAVNAQINISCDKFNGGIPREFAFPDSHIFGNGLIGPQTILTTPSITIGAAELENPALPTDRYLWGWVEYDDIFTGSTRHRTEFCFKINFERLQPTNEPWMGFEPHSRFNAIDEGCLRPIDPHANRSS